MYEVWTCQIVGGPYEGLLGLTPEAFVPLLQDHVAAYWSKASAGKYAASFVVGGTVRDPAGGCRTAVREQSPGTGRAALVLEINTHNPVGGAGVGTPGFSCFDSRTTWWCDTAFPANNRYALVHIGVGAHAMALPSSIVHEMGHTLGFPHSYTGQLPAGHPRREYDNFMDIMSGGGISPTPVGMIAANRYAAGWIPAEQVHVYAGGATTLSLHNFGSGTLMLAIPDRQGRWLSVAAREASNYNDSPVNGVELYEVYEAPTVCGNTGSPCWGTDRKVTPYPTHPTDPLAHVLTPGDQVTWNDTTITIDSAGSGGGYVVTVSDGNDTSGRFVDDDGNTHEQAIEQIAALGITRGCATDPQPLYCPERPVTRAEMAAFLLRAVGQPDPTPSYAHTFSDVSEGVWYTNYVQAFAEIGIDTGTDGKWRPDDPLTRLEMAHWLTGMFPHINAVAAPQGLFEDVDQAKWVVVEGIYQVGVTKGCSTDPLLYCPERPVTRAEMASFITRALRG